ncbi:MAG: hypothetical protein SFT92_06370 [Rickettsiales bacterium]|nr:hypothetical protein [Rickettsiales bacterium]
MGFGDSFDSASDEIERQREENEDYKTAQGMWRERYGSEYRNSMGFDPENESDFRALKEEARRNREGGDRGRY